MAFSRTITHNLYSNSAAELVVSQFYDSNGDMILPLTLEINSPDEFTVTFSEAVTASSIVRKADYVHKQSVASETWSINHNLNTDSLIVQTFSDGEQIFPDEIENDFNDSIINFSTSLAGSAAFVYVSTDFNIYPTSLDPCGLSLSTSGSYWKVGTGTNSLFVPEEVNDIESVAASGSFKEYKESSIDTDYCILEFIVDQTEDIEITEIGIFNDEGRLMFYTKCSPLFKPSNSDLRLVYKIRKYNT